MSALLREEACVWTASYATHAGVTAVNDEGENQRELLAEGATHGDPLDTLRQALDEAPNAVAVCGANGVVLFANRLAVSMFGYSAGELIGDPISRFVPDARIEAAGLRDGSVAADQCGLAVRKDGSRLPVDFSCRVVSSGDSFYLVVSFADAAERVNLDAHLVAASDDHLEFQDLISELAGQFADVEADALDELIRRSLIRIVEALQLDRATLWRWNSGDQTATPVQDGTRSSDTLPTAPLPLTSSPFIVSKLEAGEAVSFTAVDDLPDASDRATFR